MSVAQLPLDLRSRTLPGLEAFRPASAPVVGALAQWSDAAQAAAEPVLLSGPSGSGKTHLLLAVCARLTADEQTVAYLPLRDLGEQALPLLQMQPPVTALAIDDLDQAEGSRELQLALFALHNRQRDSGGRLLYALRKPAADWVDALPDLVSRLGQSTRFKLSPLDESARRDWLVEQAHRRGFALDEAVVEFAFRRTGRDLPSLNRLLDRLDQASLAEQRRVTVPFLRQILQDFDPS